MMTNIVVVEVLEITKLTILKSNEQGNDFRVAQRSFSVSGFG